LVTLDTSLPNCSIDKNETKPLAINLDALLQWVFPIAFSSDTYDDVARTYSQILKFELLPKKQIIDAADFAIFNEFDIDCRELPAQDIKDCITRIKSMNLNPNEPSDREIMQREIRHFLIAREKKQNPEIERLENQIKKLKDEMEAERQQSAKNRLVVFAIFATIGVVLISWIVFHLTAHKDETWFDTIKRMEWCDMLYLLVYPYLVLCASIIIGKNRLSYFKRSGTLLKSITYW